MPPEARAPLASGLPRARGRARPDEPSPRGSAAPAGAGRRDLPHPARPRDVLLRARAPAGRRLAAARAGGTSAVPRARGVVRPRRPGPLRGRGPRDGDRTPEPRGRFRDARGGAHPPRPRGARGVDHAGLPELRGESRSRRGRRSLLLDRVRRHVHACPHRALTARSWRSRSDRHGAALTDRAPCRAPSSRSDRRGPPTRPACGCAP